MTASSMWYQICQWMDTTTNKPRGTVSLQAILHNEELFDTWKCHHANKKDYTFFSHRHFSYLRIDMFLMEKWLLQHIETAKIHDITWSDHAEISLTILEKGVSSSPPIWRCNVRLLQESHTHTKITQHLQNVFLNNTESFQVPYVLRTRPI